MDKTEFQEKELEILREAIDKAGELAGRKIISSGKIGDIINILEDFLRKKTLVCYGGTAINNILPLQAQFYDRSIEIPDYDFFSPNALEDAKELADLYYSAGYEEVEAKAGIHSGTFKVFVNYIPVADITYLDRKLFVAVSKESIKVNGILYAPPNYLRMAMYLELSRPAGDVSRWEKVLKRLILLNKFYPLKGENCDAQDFQRSFEGSPEDQRSIYNIVKSSFIDQSVIFFGGFANTLYSKYMPKYQRKILNEIPDFDVLSEEPQKTALITKERLQYSGYKDVKIIKRKGIGEIIAPHYEISVGKDTVAFIYEPLACHSYNVVNIGGFDIRVATIDTMLSFYLAFIYADRPYYDYDRILCMAHYLFSVQAKNRLQQKGVLKRFSIKCYGKQETLETIRAEKSEKFKELKDDKKSREFEYNFLRYIPAEIKKSKAGNVNTRKNKSKTKSKTKSKSKSKTKRKNKSRDNSKLKRKNISKNKKTRRIKK
jgi:hypothetical protein